MNSGQKKKKTSASEAMEKSRESSHSVATSRSPGAEKKGRRQSDILFANIIEKMNEGFVSLDTQMNYTYLNERGSELLQRDPADLIGKNYWEEFPQDTDIPFGRAYRQALETQTPIELEDYYALRDRWFENRIYPSADGLSIFFNDITDRKRAEQALRDSEERFQTLANGSPVLLWVNGLEGCEFVNREYLDFLGVGKMTDVRGYDWSSFVHPEDRESYVAAYQRAFEAQSPFRDEFRFRRHDGQYRWMQSEATPRHAQDGIFLGYVGASVDITERKQVEEALREKDKQLHRVTYVTPTLFSHCSRDLRYLFVNRAAAEFLGVPAEEIIGRPIRDITGEDAFHAVLPYIERVLQGEQVEYELEIPYRVMGPRFMHVIYSPDTDENGNVAGWIATATDITERKRMENERSQLLAGEQVLRAEAEYARAEAEQAEAGAEQAKGEAERELAERKLAEEALGAWSSTPLPQEARSAWLRYGMAFVSAAVAVVLRGLLDPLLGDSVPYALLLGSVAFSIWYGGVGPAVVSLVIGVLSIQWLVLETNRITGPTPADLISFVIVVFSGLIIMALGRAMGSAQRHAHQSARVALERQRQAELQLQEQLRVEAALRESERKFSLIYNRLPFAAALSSPTDGVIRDVNQEFENVFGYTRQEAIGKTSLELGINADLSQQGGILAELLLAGSVHNLELVLATRTQGERVFLINLDLVELEGQKHVLQTAQDITERKRVEEALRQLEERFSQAFHTSPVLKLIVRADNEQIVDINESNARTFEYTRAETLGKPVQQVIQFADEEKRAALFTDLQARGSIENQEVKVRTSSGTLRSVIFSAHPVSLGGEKHFLYTILDITERKQAEEALRQLNLELESRVERRTSQLQAANQALEESQKRLRALSQRLVEVQEEERRAIARELHDRVGQSLSALNLNLAIINSQLSSFVNEEVNARLSDCIHLVADVISLVRDVMANLRPTILDDFGLEAALQMYLQDFQARYLISTQFEKDAALLPRLGAGIEMTLLRITQECLLNVARHAQAHQVALSLQMEENMVRLIVQDDGVGIQSWQSANRPGGHGLMIMRERAEAVSGNLRVSSTPGKGTQIEVSIPLQTKTLEGKSS